MSSNSKQRLTLTNLSEPQQMRELNRQLTWIWDQLLGGLNMKSLNASTRETIESKVSADDVESAIAQSAAEILITIKGINAPGIDTGEEGVQVRITKDVFEVNVPGENGDFSLDETGAKVPVLTADKIVCLNVASRYNGPSEIYVNPLATDDQVESGEYHRSFRSALDSLSGKQLDHAVVIELADGMIEYGEFVLNGTSGSGSVSIYGNPDDMPKLIGGLKLKSIPFQVNLFGLHIQTEHEGIYASGCPLVDIAVCRIDGPGAEVKGSRCVVSDRGSSLVVRGTELYNCERSLFGRYGGVISAFSCMGNCRVAANWSTMYLSSAMPCDSSQWTKVENAGQIIEQDVYVEQGTPPGISGLPATSSFLYSQSDSYCGGWSLFSDNDVRQGYNGKPIYGVIWFDAAAIQAAIGTKAVQQASIRLHMRTGVGRGVAVDVQLYGSDVSADKAEAPVLKREYGLIGRTNPGELNELMIPVQAVNDLISGEIGALVLKSADDQLYGDRKYSRNYARFSGSTSADESNCPMLTVVYQ